jgi:hypothetical protein
MKTDLAKELLDTKQDLVSLLRGISTNLEGAKLEKFRRELAGNLVLLIDKLESTKLGAYIGQAFRAVLIAANFRAEICDTLVRILVTTDLQGQTVESFTQRLVHTGRVDGNDITRLLQHLGVDSCARQLDPHRRLGRANLKKCLQKADDDDIRWLLEHLALESPIQQSDDAEEIYGNETEQQLEYFWAGFSTLQSSHAQRIDDNKSKQQLRDLGTKVFTQRLDYVGRLDCNGIRRLIQHRGATELEAYMNAARLDPLPVLKSLHRQLNSLQSVTPDEQGDAHLSLLDEPGPDSQFSAQLKNIVGHLLEVLQQIKLQVDATNSLPVLRGPSKAGTKDNGLVGIAVNSLDVSQAKTRSSEEVFEENVLAVLQLRDDLRVKIQSLDPATAASTNRADNDLSTLLDELRSTNVALLEATTEGLQNLSASIEALSKAGATASSAQAILSSLRFKEMPMRYIQIPDAYANTNAWILQRGESPFASWLTDMNGVFWINGKAGSGKSTMVKFLADHNRTRDLLKQWAGLAGADEATSQRKLAVVGYYFWKAGFPMQKSLKGLLQSLLYNILRQ